MKVNVLEKILDKAIKNGFADSFEFYEGDIETHYHWTFKTKGQEKEYFYIYNEYEIIFNHDFAKAFWGNDDVYGHCGKSPEDFQGTNKKCCAFADSNCEWFEKRWQYHLQKMVLEEDPIKYLEQFL